MGVYVHHSWQVTAAEAVQIQRDLADRVKETPLSKTIRRIAGTDCAYVDNERAIVAAAVVCDSRSGEVIERSYAVCPCTFPYIPGFLSFRETPAVVAAIARLSSPPDLLMCDGQGRAHPRGLGLACHLGLLLALPSIGIAKSRLCGTYAMPGLRKGCSTRLRHAGKMVGRVVRTRDKVKPVYVSVGNLINLKDAVRWVLRMARGYRLPEPTRQAHLYVTGLRKRPPDPGNGREDNPETHSL